MTTEAKLQQKVIQLFKQHDILAFKTDSTSTRGWPDLTVIYPSGAVIFIEMKTKTGRLSPDQVRVHALLRKQKGIVYVVRSLQEAENLIEAH